MIKTLKNYTPSVIKSFLMTFALLLFQRSVLAEEYISTTFVNLIANEERFDNQLIATYGVFCKAYEGKVAIYPDEGSCNNLVTFNSIELKFPNGKKSDFFSEDDLGKYVAVKGYYLKNTLGGLTLVI